MSDVPLLITPGDPAGIGPEIALKALYGDKTLRSYAVLMGDKAHLTSLAKAIGIAPDFASWQQGRPLEKERITLYDITWPAPVIAGKADPANAPLVIDTIKTAAELAMQGKVSGIVTCPIAKSNLYEAGFAYPGHTEYLGALSHDKTPIMMLANDHLRVVPATIHIPLKEVSNALSSANLSSLITQLVGALQQDFDIMRPHIALCGLNPHAGEDGKMGDEEQTIISPAITQASKALGKEAILSGPIAADSLFHSEKIAQFDCVIGMYHDQVLIPVKTIDFHGSVNVTLGLDFVRTSPDHGTAFDIADRFIAKADSLARAIIFAHQMAANRAMSKKA